MKNLFQNHGSKIGWGAVITAIALAYVQNYNGGLARDKNQSENQSYWKQIGELRKENTEMKERISYLEGWHHIPRHRLKSADEPDG